MTYKFLSRPVCEISQQWVGKMHFALNFISIGALWLISLQLVSVFNRRRLERKLGAQPITNVAPDGFFGVRSGFKMLEYKRSGTSTEFLRIQFSRLPKPHVPLFMFKIFGKKVIMTRDPENIKAILATQSDDFSMALRRDLFRPVFGDGIFTADGERWSHLRTMLRPLFARSQVGKLSTLEPHVQLLASHIRRSQGQKFDFQTLLYRFTIDTATAFLFGGSSKSLENFGPDAETDEWLFPNAFNTVQDYLTDRKVAQGVYFWIRGRKYERSLQIVKDFVDAYVTKALDMLAEDLEMSAKDRSVFLHSLCHQIRDPKLLHDLSMNLLIAGRDTTASFIVFAFFEIARNPDIWTAVKKEVNDNFGTSTDQITFESLKLCQYLKALLNEVLRMYPGAATNSRTAKRNTTLPRGGGPDGMSPFLLEKGQNIMFAIYAMHRNPAIYGADAQTFDPLRWLDGRTKGLKWEFLPFGGGARTCLGQQFALTETSYVVVRLAQMFQQVSLANPNSDYPPKIMTHFSIKLKEGLEVHMS